MQRIDVSLLLSHHWCWKERQNHSDGIFPKDKMSMRLGNDAGTEPAFSDTFGKCRVRKALLGLLWPIPGQFSTRNEKIRTRLPWDMDNLKRSDDDPEKRSAFQSISLRF